MKIENTLMTGNDLESLKYQAVMLRGESLKLGTEGFTDSALAKRLMDTFSQFSLNVRDFMGKSISVTAEIGEMNYKLRPQSIRLVKGLNYGRIRSYVIPSVPETNAQMKDWLGYMDALADVVINIIRFTIPGCIEYFSLLLEDVTVLSSESASSAIDRLSTNKYALGQLEKKYPGIVNRNDKLLARTTMGSQYSSINDFIDCQEFFAEIVKKSGAINVVQASKDINRLNEMVSRVIMQAKRKNEMTINESVVRAVSEYLYGFAEEVALISAYATFLDTTMVALDGQLDTIIDQAGV